MCDCYLWWAGHTSSSFSSILGIPFTTGKRLPVSGQINAPSSKHTCTASNTTTIPSSSRSNSSQSHNRTGHTPSFFIVFSASIQAGRHVVLVCGAEQPWQPARHYPGSCHLRFLGHAHPPVLGLLLIICSNIRQLVSC